MRYVAQRYGTWEWLDLDLPLTTDGPEWALNTYGVLEGTVAPELGLQMAEDGRPVLEEWGTFVHAETGEGAGSRRWSGIVARSELRGKEWFVEVREFPAYLEGTPIEALVRGVVADPADLMRQVWQDVQAMPNAWHGVTVQGSTSARVGTRSDDLAAAARATMDARKQTLDSLNKSKNKETSELQDMTVTLADEVAQARTQVSEAQATVNTLVAAGAPAAEIANARATVVSRQATLTATQAAYTAETNAKKNALRNARTNKDAAQKAYDSARDAYDKAKERAREDGGAYEFRPEEVPDALDSIRDMCEANDIEWATTTRYSDDFPVLGIRVAHPQIGARRDDLVFEQGINIVSELHLVRNGEEYANAGVGIGAGEGTKAVRSSIASTSPRMRRVAVVEDKNIKKKADLTAQMRKDIRRRSGEPYVQEIEVVDHPLAPMFSWNVGDHILIQGEVPHYGDYAELHKIISWEMMGDHKARLYLHLSSTY